MSSKLAEKRRIEIIVMGKKNPSGARFLEVIYGCLRRCIASLHLVFAN